MDHLESPAMMARTSIPFTRCPRQTDGESVLCTDIMPAPNASRHRLAAATPPYIRAVCANDRDAFQPLSGWSKYTVYLSAHATVARDQCFSMSRCCNGAVEQQGIDLIV
ncbi:hypothetical protein FIBSPDRAFT_535112 [Athelia psychrophila]|uniref:Uncharacterized protein n=1 Tax=Athelia psychrophila TaxID=1759441 RepID=A0A166J4F2_9AGAM|nr:hypothetical protein FIBSPDRAFT_535112 [Fibularhizoctonia sp. CBS 109695]